MRYAYSVDGGHTFSKFSYPNRARAIEEAVKNHPDADKADVFTCALIPYYPKIGKLHIDVKALVRQVKDRAEKDCGEITDSWLKDMDDELYESLEVGITTSLYAFLGEVSRKYGTDNQGDKLDARLNKFFRSWLKKKKLEPMFFKVDKVKPAFPEAA